MWRVLYCVPRAVCVAVYAVMLKEAGGIRCFAIGRICWSAIMITAHQRKIHMNVRTYGFQADQCKLIR